MRRMTSWRPRAIVAAAVAAATSAVACIAGCAPAPGTGPWPAPAAGPVTVTILTGADTSISAGDLPVQSDTGMYSQLADWWNAYEAPATGIRVRLDSIDGGATLEHSEMLADAQASDARYDVYNLDSQWVPEFAAAGYIRLLEGHLGTSGFLPQPLASGKDASGRLYAAPFTTDVGLLYSRTDLVGPTSPLGTFDQVMRAARQARAADPAIAEGYAGQFADYEGLTVNLLEIIRGNAPDAIGPDGTIRDPTAVAAGLQQLVSQIGLQVPAAELSASEAQSFTAFATGKAVFMRNWPIWYNQVATATLPGSSEVASHFKVTPLPFPSVLGGQDLAIAASSPHPDAALQVISFLTSQQAERCLFAVGGFPATRQSAYASENTLPAGYQAPGYPPVSGSPLPLCGNRPGRQLKIGSTILQAIGKTIPRPVTPYYTEFSTLIQNHVWPLLQAASQDQRIDLRAAVAALAADIQYAVSGHAPVSPGGTRPPPGPPSLTGSSP